MHIAETNTKSRQVLGTKPLNVKLSRHCLATLVVADAAKLLDSKSFSNALHEIIHSEGAVCVGEVTYDFSNKSFTGVFALSESHISVHTWPERMTVQLDVFLCNYMHDNRGKCERLFDAIVAYFDPKEIEAIHLDRL